MNHDTHLHLQSTPHVIGSVTDFTYKWGLNAGLSDPDAGRLTLAVDELVTDVVQFAFDDVGEFDLTFRQLPEGVEIILHELGLPFDPERHRFDRERAIAEGMFEGAGLELIRHLVDDFIFLNRGRAGKEFRLVKRYAAEHIADLVLEGEDLFRRPSDPAPDTTYALHPVTHEDAEAIARLIYRTYGYTYVKEELYFPKKIERALERGDKFGVMACTAEGEPVGSFAVLRTTDSRIGEVGEAVVAIPHRRRGVMTQMLHELIEMAKARGLLGLFGEAITMHPYSQMANARFNMHSTALLLALFPSVKYRNLDAPYPQDISVLIEFLPLTSATHTLAYLPEAYAEILTDMYGLLGLTPEDDGAAPAVMPAEAGLRLSLSYEFHHAGLVTEHYGDDFLGRVADSVTALKAEGMHVVYLDLPLDDPHTPTVVEGLRAMGFVFAGLMPLFHQERDYLRLQQLFVPLDFGEIHLYSPMAHRIKALIEEELS